jgi:hypothetical protein
MSHGGKRVIQPQKLSISSTWKTTIAFFWSNDLDRFVSHCGFDRLEPHV